MGRSATSVPTETRSLLLSGDNLEHLERIAWERRRVGSVAFAEELDFARTLGLPGSELWAMRREAGRRGLTPWQHTAAVIKAFAISLPAARPAPGRPTGPGRRTTINIREDRLRWLEALGASEQLSFPAAVNLALDFARAYRLPPDLLAAVDAQAARQGDDRRGAVVLHVWTVARGLLQLHGPPVPAPAATHGKRRR